MERKEPALTPLAGHLVCLMPELCGVIPPLAVVTSEYVLGSFPKLPSNYQPNDRHVFAAAAADDLQQLQYLIEQKHVSPNERDASGLTPLHFAASKGNLQVTQYLISRGASVDACSVNGGTPLMFAARLPSGKPVLEYLLQHHNQRDQDSADIPAHILSLPNQTAYRSLLPSSAFEPEPTLLTAAATYPNPSSAVPVLAPAALIPSNSGLRAQRLCDMRDRDGETVLHIAARLGLADVLTRLVRDYGMNPNDRSTGTQRTPLHFAAFARKVAAVRCLVEELGADVNAHDKEGNSPITLASRFNADNIVDYLKRQKRQSSTRALQHAI